MLVLPAAVSDRADRANDGRTRRYVQRERRMHTRTGKVQIKIDAMQVR